MQKHVYGYNTGMLLNYVQKFFTCAEIYFYYCFFQTGLCLLQGGPPTTFLATSLVEDLLWAAVITAGSALEKFVEGLRTTGILQV